jgi:MFS family permease
VRHLLRLALLAIFAATGMSALILQVVWQRVLSLHAGIDLLAATTVVVAFMAGLGIGNLAGGALADRLGPRGCCSPSRCRMPGSASLPGRVCGFSTTSTAGSSSGSTARSRWSRSTSCCWWCRPR